MLMMKDLSWPLPRRKARSPREVSQLWNMIQIRTRQLCEESVNGMMVGKNGNIESIEFSQTSSENRWLRKTRNG